jgi:hypothetical protein
LTLAISSWECANWPSVVVFWDEPIVYHVGWPEWILLYSESRIGRLIFEIISDVERPICIGVGNILGFGIIEDLLHTIRSPNESGNHSTDLGGS